MKKIEVYEHEGEYYKTKIDALRHIKESILISAVNDMCRVINESIPIYHNTDASRLELKRNLIGMIEEFIDDYGYRLKSVKELKGLDS